MPRARSGQVIVIGSSNTDLVVSVDRIPKPGETVLGHSFTLFAGGKGANQAVAAARAGASTKFVGAFGNDENGRKRRQDLLSDGIDCSASVILPGKPSGVALIALENGGKRKKSDNAIVVASGANQYLSSRTVARALAKIDAQDVVLCSLEVPMASVETAIKAARARGATVILNPAPSPVGGLSTRTLAGVNYLTPNEHEFFDLLHVRFDSPDVSARFKVLERACRRYGHAPVMVITRGASGVTAYQPGMAGFLAVRPPKVTAVDTVGAGDCFSGAFAAALAQGETDLREVLRFAVCASALCVTKKGAQAAMPRKQQILRLLRSLH
jgi:ribokinase